MTQDEIQKPLSPSIATPPLAPQFVATLTTSHTGPLPPPEILARYEQAFPGCAERIIAMAEKQAAHRQQCELRLVDAPIAEARAGRVEAKRGQMCAVVTVLTAFVCAAAIVIVQPNAPGATVATALSGTTILGIVTAFIVGRKSQVSDPDKIEKSGDGQARAMSDDA